MNFLKKTLKEFMPQKWRIQVKHFSEYLKLMKIRSGVSVDSKFVIVGQGRTGSQLLVSLLNKHPEIYCDSEIFHPEYFGKIIWPKSYIKSREMLAEKKDKSVYGFKVKHYQLLNDQKIKPKKLFEYLNQEGWKFIYLNRSNLLRHSLSNFKANESGVYHSAEKKQYQKLKIDPQELISYMKGKEQFKKEECEALEGISYLSVNYEKDLSNAECQQRTANQIFEYLNLQSVDVRSEYKKTSLKDLKDMIENYEEVKTALVKTKFVKFLED